jgi:uncharacterized protein (DUF58 family)
VTTRNSPRLLAYAALAGLGLISGLASGRVDLIVYACPFVVFLLVGLAVAQRPTIEAESRLDTDRVLEGEPVALVVALRSTIDLRRLELAVQLPAGTRVADRANVRAVELAAGHRREVTVTLVPERWGSHALGAVALRAHDRLSLHVFEQALPAPAIVRVYPHPERLRRLAHPSRTQLFAGDRVAKRAAGEGIELADLRLFLPGDRRRDINWRVSARRNELWVTQRHPERSTDVVLFVDMFDEATLLPAVRVAATLADAYVGSRDRVGLVGFGGLLQWVQAGQGTRQLYRLLDTLLDARAFFSYAWKDVSIIPPRVLVPGALVIGVTPLEDERTSNALVDLRARGFDVAIIELTSHASRPPPATELDAVAHRLWLLQRAHNRSRFRQYGIPVAEWHDDLPFSSTMEALWDASRAPGARHHVSSPP